LRDCYHRRGYIMTGGNGQTAMLTGY
jgi:hypothetical protein